MRPVLALFVAVAVVGCGRPPAEPTTPKNDPPANGAKANPEPVKDDTPPVGPVDAFELLREYHESPTTAAAKYGGGKRVAVRLKVTSVEQDKEAVKLIDRPALAIGQRVIVTVPPGDAELAAKSKGQPVTCVGVITRKTNSEVFMDGRVVP
jgi:hypothetical protein